MLYLFLSYPGHYYTDEQLLNIYTFSMLYQWIYNTQDSLSYQRESSEPKPITVLGRKTESPSPSLVSQPSFEKLELERSTSSEKLSASLSSAPKSLEKLGSSPKRSGSGKMRSQTPVTSPQKATSGGQTRTKTPLFEQKSLSFERRSGVIPKTIFDALVGRSMDYCFRILDQCERSR